jgi:hypothetical protein
MAMGFLVVIPAVSLTVWALARLGIGNPGVRMVQAIRMTTLFAGVAAVLTAGGVGRLAAHASLLPGGRRTAVWRAARAQAVAGAGLAVIASIPHGYLPSAKLAWASIAAAGFTTGALAGALIGLVCGAPAAERIPDLLRRMPMLAEWARAVRRDQRRRAGVSDPRKSGKRALQTEVARAAAPVTVTRMGRPRAARAEGSAVVDSGVKTRPQSLSDLGDTPLPKPVPLGEDTPLPAPDPGDVPKGDG